MFRSVFVSLALTASLSAGTQIFQTFEGDGFDDWQTEGSAFGLAPVAEKTEAMNSELTNYAGESLAVSAHGGDEPKGTLRSPEITLTEPFIHLLIAGGDYAGKTAAQLIIGGKVVRETVGKRNLKCEPARWDVAEFKGQNATIRLVDDESGAWGIICVDQIVLTDAADYAFPASTHLTKSEGDGLVETKVIAGVRIAPDSQLKIEATYKDLGVNSPTALTFDDQGRIYLSETHRFREGVEDDRDHLYWYLDDLASKTTADRRALHEKWKEKCTIEHMTKKSEVIRRLADTNGDGKLDEVKEFAAGFNDVLDGTAAGIFYYEGSIYFSCIPKITMLRDTNNDGVADERKVVEQGFGVRISLSGHDLNGFALGQDGRIYGTCGDRGLSFITKEGVSYDYPNEGCAFRFEPDGTGFEIFHTGLRNPKEIAFDALGNAFSVDNNSDQGDAARVVYLVEGGDTGWQMEHQAMHSFHRQIGLKEHPPSRWMDERIWEKQNPVQPAYVLPPAGYLSSGPSGLTANPGVGFLEREAGRFLICDYRGGAANSGIWSFAMKEKGAGMTLADRRKFAWGIAATDVEYSWDGKVVISDFVTGWSSHEDGRVLSLDAGEKTWQAAEVASAAKLMKEGFEQRSSAVLANLLKHPDARIRLRAQLALTRKDDALPRFTEAADSSNFLVRVHAIQGLGIIARRGAALLPVAAFGTIPTAKNLKLASQKLISLLADKDPEIRAQSLKALADFKDEAGTVPIAKLLADESPRVQFFAAILVGKRQRIDQYSAICDLLEENNNRDVYLRHACIYALQHMAPKPSVISALFQNESAAVRLAAVVALRRMKSSDIYLFLNDADPKVQDEAIRAICDMDLSEQRPMVADLLDDLTQRSWTPFMLRRLVHNAFRLGTPENLSRVLKIAADAKTPEPVRKEALRLATEWAEPFPVDQFTGHWRPLAKRDPAALRPAFTAALPGLLKQDGEVLTAALGLVKNYQLVIPGLDTAALTAFVKNTALPEKARATALELVIANKPADLAAFLTEISNDKSDEVVLTALAAIAKSSPAAALPPLISAANSDKIPRAQKTWEILASLPGEAVDTLFTEKLSALQAAQGNSPTGIELLDAAKKRSAPSVVAALAAFEKSITASADPLAKYNIALQGGDVTNGSSLFTSHPASECMRCHRAAEGHASGGETAPNLAGIATRHTDRRYFLESMVQPSAVIAPGYGNVLVDFKNGASLNGNLIAETPDHLDVDTTDKKSYRIQRSDVANLTPPISPMPPMGDLLKPSELRDIIAWLATLNKGELPKAVSTPVPLDPSTLKIPEAVKTATDIDPAIMKLGKQQYLVCSACHGSNGEGGAAAPPLAGSEWVNGPAENLIRIQLRGLQGPITVKSKEYDIQGGMAALAYQTDDQIAAVITYIRNSFGNSAPGVLPAAVTALRSEVGKPQLRATDLLPPIPVATANPAPATPAAATPIPPATLSATPGKYADLKTAPARSYLLPFGLGLLLLGLLALALKKS